MTDGQRPPALDTMKASLSLGLLGVGLALLCGCAHQKQELTPPTSPDQVGEVRPGSGYLRGYLAPKDVPDSLKLLPPPPAKETPAAAADAAAYRQSRALSNSPRWRLAAQDTKLQFPEAAATFACALGIEVSAEQTPNLNMLLRRSLSDAGLATYRAKDHYARLRPYIENKSTTCNPADETKHSKDGSYPSGHAAIGWAWALLLSEIAPERSDALLKRGYAFGQSRVVCAFHWQSDVDAGRIVAAATVARLHADPVFRAQMDAASAEIKAARLRHEQATRDCTEEFAILQ